MGTRLAADATGLTSSLDELEQQVVEKFSDALKLPVELLRKARQIHDLPVDSIDLMQVVVLIEDDFGVAISDDEWARVTSFRDIAETIDAHERDRAGRVRR